MSIKSTQSLLVVNEGNVQLIEEFYEHDENKFAVEQNSFNNSNVPAFISVITFYVQAHYTHYTKIQSEKN